MSPADRRWCGGAGMNGVAGGVLWTGFPFLLADGSAPGMPNKHNDDRRHPIPKMTFTVTNWAIYEGGTTGRSTFAPSPRTKTLRADPGQAVGLVFLSGRG
jgi:hypothetical protein